MTPACRSRLHYLPCMNNVKGVIFDLDGTLLDTGNAPMLTPGSIFANSFRAYLPCFYTPCLLTIQHTAESFVIEAVKDVVESHGKSLTPEAIQASTGRRPLEAWQAVKDVLDIGCSAQQLFDESEPVLTERLFSCCLCLCFMATSSQQHMHTLSCTMQVQ